MLVGVTSSWRWSLLLAVLITMTSCKKRTPTAADPMIAFKRLDELPKFSIEVDEAGQDSLRKSPREWVRGTFVHGSERIADVGVRLKGHRSMRKLSEKPALKIRFDKYKKGTRFRGVRHLTLNNMVEDPTLLREVLGYRLYRELGVYAPAAFYARLEFAGQDYGLYAVIETVDKAFLNARFSDASGGLYEGDYGCDLYEDDVAGFDRDSGKKKTKKKNGEKGKKVDDRSDLMAFAKLAGGDADLLFSDRGPIDMKSFLAYLAVSAFIGDFDGYRHAHNYRVYHEPTLGKWFFLPWGIDRSFKQQLSIFESYGRLARRCFEHAKCRADYVRVQRDVVAAFEKLKLAEGAEALAAFIEPVLKESGSRMPRAKRINKSRQGLLRFLRERPSSIAKETACIGASGGEIDGDGDGFGCLDCDDSNASISPKAQEVCDGIDNDCSGAIDDDASCPTCPVHEIGGQRFAACNLPRTWVEAEAYCKSLGGKLATVATSENNSSLTAKLKSVVDGRWWIGLSDRALEGTFVAEADPSGEFSNWGKGEPDNSTCNQDCAVIDTKRKGRWHDTHCGQFAPFVCALP